MDKINYEKLLNEITDFVKTIPECNDNLNGRGVVICGGNIHYNSGSIIVDFLKNYSKDINIEWYYVGDELNNEYIQSLKERDVDVINCLNVLPNWWYNEITETDIKGFMIKPFALMQSKFEDILLLDSDNIPIKDISFLFKYPDYIEHGNLFWSDYNYNYEIKKNFLPMGIDIYSKLKIKSPFQNNINLTESGQILINKKKMWKGICLSYYLNYNKDIFYKMVYGDKDLYYIAFQLLNLQYKQCNYYPDGIGNDNSVTTMINKNPIDNTPLFVHYTLNKIAEYKYIKPTNYFNICNSKINIIRNGYIIFDKKVLNLNSDIKKDLLELYNFTCNFDRITKDITKKKILICTPTYGYSCDIRYLKCLLETKDFLLSKGIDVDISFIGYESLISRGRNTFVARFLADPKNTHLLFIDGDIMWEKEDVLKLIIKNKSIIGGLYPQKKYDWKKLDSASNDESYKLLKYNVNFLKNNTRVNNGLISVKSIATGFMMIQRNVFLRMIYNFPEMKYCDDINCCKNKDEEKYLYAFFDCAVIDNHYLSEDYFFCNLWKKLNGNVYADLSINLCHIGSEIYSGKPSTLVQT